MCPGFWDLSEGPKEVDVYFFDLDYDPTSAQLAEEYDLRDFRPDFAAQAAVNEEDPTFADERPNALQWDMQNGVASSAIFGRWHGGRAVDIRRNNRGWRQLYRFGGVLK